MMPRTASERHVAFAMAVMLMLAAGAVSWKFTLERNQDGHWVQIAPLRYEQVWKSRVEVWWEGFQSAK